MLDVPAITQGMLSTSSNPQFAATAVSFLSDDGLSFATQTPALSRATEAKLTFPRMACSTAPSSLRASWRRSGRCTFTPAGCIRSWKRTLLVTVDVTVADGVAHFGRVQGAFLDKDEDPLFTVRVLDYLLRSHALGEVFPAVVSLKVCS